MECDQNYCDCCGEFPETLFLYGFEWLCLECKVEIQLCKAELSSLSEV